MAFILQQATLSSARAYWESKDKQLNIYIEGHNLLDTNDVAISNVVPDASGSDSIYLYPAEAARFMWLS